MVLSCVPTRTTPCGSVKQHQERQVPPRHRGPFASHSGRTHSGRRHSGRTHSGNAPRRHVRTLTCGPSEEPFSSRDPPNPFSPFPNGRTVDDSIRARSTFSVCFAEMFARKTPPGRRRRRRLCCAAVVMFGGVLTMIALYVLLLSRRLESVPAAARVGGRDGTTGGPTRGEEDGGGPVVLMSNARSGSTLLGDVFANGWPDDVFYVYEPLKSFVGRHEVLASVADCTVFDRDRDARKVFWHDGESRDAIRRTCEDAARSHVYKIIRMTERSREQIDEEGGVNPLNERVGSVHPHTVAVLRALNAKVVFLVRHPGAVLSSAARLGWRFGRSDRMWIRNICRANELMETIAADPTIESTYVRFEDLVSESRRDEIERVVRFSGIVDDISTSALDNVVNGVLDTNAHTGGHFRRSRTVADAWRSRVTASQLAIIAEECRVTCDLFHYDCVADQTP